MARLYGQLFSLIFLVVGVGGLMLTGLYGGELGSLGVRLTWLRDAVNCGLAVVMVAVGFVLGRRAGRVAVAAAGVLLVGRGVAGLVVGTRTVAGLDFSVSVAVFDLVSGILAILCALGTIEDEAETA